jgi:hypothetical protein
MNAMICLRILIILIACVALIVSPTQRTAAAGALNTPSEPAKLDFNADEVTFDDRDRAALDDTCIRLASDSQTIVIIVSHAGVFDRPSIGRERIDAIIEYLVDQLSSESGSIDRSRFWTRVIDGPCGEEPVHTGCVELWVGHRGTDPNVRLDCTCHRGREAPPN